MNFCVIGYAQAAGALCICLRRADQSELGSKVGRPPASPSAKIAERGLRFRQVLLGRLAQMRFRHGAVFNDSLPLKQMQREVVVCLRIAALGRLLKQRGSARRVRWYSPAAVA